MARGAGVCGVVHGKDGASLARDLRRAIDPPRVPAPCTCVIVIRTDRIVGDTLALAALRTHSGAVSLSAAAGMIRA